ncbi:major facilitator superfamily domain-containing protein [Gymnopilus junonius]|uniref:Major facilitator superfamily domain-containing protein n=1 Tax=Gymnopilus junonius TaxID=109634 RepID=A0A9P5NUA4_GYMJU|nr:major facilitator superfamily domain-containing protein [Gymnopilus junonius]
MSRSQLDISLSSNNDLPLKDLSLQPHTRPDNDLESALDTLPVLEHPYPPAPLDASKTDTTNTIYELHSAPTYLSERSRRPSALNRQDSEKSVYTVTAHPFNGESSLAPSVLDQAPEGSSLGVNQAASMDVSSANLNTAQERLSKKQQQRYSMLHFLSLCWSVWLMGWNDGTAGPMLPRWQEQYKVGFSVVSMIFVGSCFGYICGAALNVWLNDRVGMGKILVLGAVCQSIGYAIIIPAPPFPLLICAYVIVGFSESIQNAQANGFVGSLHEHMSTKLGMMHGAYGFGALTTPFSSTYFSGFANKKWAYHYILSEFFSLLNLCFIIYVFRFRRQEDVLLEGGQEPSADSTVHPQGGSKYRQIFALKSIPLLTIFSVIYIGVEVTLGGWIVTFIIRERHGGHSSGYISSGLTLGRIGLMWLNKMVGAHRIIIIYSLIAIALELTIWFVPSIIENAVAVSLIGLVLACVGLVAGIGVAGSAAVPFVTGLLAAKYGIASLQPLMISMISVLLLVWMCVPKTARRVE